MLPRRHILDVWHMTGDTKNLASMATLSLALDALKYMRSKPNKDHLVEALELNEFICFMFPMQRPKNRSLLFHVVSDLTGLLLYGVPHTRKHVIQNIETINYSEKNMEIYPVMEVWNTLKKKIYVKKHGGEDVIQGFIKKIRVEMDAIERYPFVEDVFFKSRERIDEWLPTFTGYYGESRKKIKNTYDQWWKLWNCKADTDVVLHSMVDRLAVQAKDDFQINVEKDAVFAAILSDKSLNKQENDRFSRHYKYGLDLLLKI